MLVTEGTKTSTKRRLHLLFWPLSLLFHRFRWKGQQFSGS